MDSLSLVSALEMILAYLVRIRSRTSLRHYARSTFLATYTMNLWRAWWPYSSIEVSYYVNFLVNLPKLASNSTLARMELLGFLTRGSLILSNRALMFQDDASTCQLVATNGMLPSSNAILVLSNMLLHVAISSTPIRERSSSWFLWTTFQRVTNLVLSSSISSKEALIL